MHARMLTSGSRLGCCSFLHVALDIDTKSILDTRSTLDTKSTPLADSREPQQQQQQQHHHHHPGHMLRRPKDHSQRPLRLAAPIKSRLRDLSLAIYGACTATRPCRRATAVVECGVPDFTGARGCACGPCGVTDIRLGGLPYTALELDRSMVQWSAVLDAELETCFAPSSSTAQHSTAQRAPSVRLRAPYRPSAYVQPDGHLANGSGERRVWFAECQRCGCGCPLPPLPNAESDGSVGWICADLPSCASSSRVLCAQ
ncbi:hypothetical protein PMIN01_05361 [Paraphaeosphaeria minitans]|uniref:Uncharacterized protein n=1 Tax=Paraphaeosphaeria minitans TaxID=565426 RepID=A0A9P6GKU3_9PLEO|nr:hypothetical protein PMIN01_05361 [Paraphaeosphaeria minitans]